MRIASHSQPPSKRRANDDVVQFSLRDTAFQPDIAERSSANGTSVSHCHETASRHRDVRSEAGGFDPDRPSLRLYGCLAAMRRLWLAPGDVSVPSPLLVGLTASPGGLSRIGAPGADRGQAAGGKRLRATSRLRRRDRAAKGSSHPSERLATMRRPKRGPGRCARVPAGKALHFQRSERFIDGTTLAHASSRERKSRQQRRKL
jgi:hypothetical protein